MLCPLKLTELLRLCLNRLCGELIDIRGATWRIYASTDHQQATGDAQRVQGIGRVYFQHGDGYRQRQSGYPARPVWPAQCPAGGPRPRWEPQPPASPQRPSEARGRCGGGGSSAGGGRERLDGSVRDEVYHRQKPTGRFVAFTKGAITSKIKHAIKLKTSPARPVRRHWLQAKTKC